MTFPHILLTFCIGFLSSAKGLLSKIFFGPPEKDFSGNFTGKFQDFPEDGDLGGRQIVFLESKFRQEIA